jgi:hypothetical protein
MMIPPMTPLAPHSEKASQQERKDNLPREPDVSEIRPELVALIRMLLREPPADHDFKTCPICEGYGITSI